MARGHRDGREVYVSDTNGSIFDLSEDLVEELKAWFARAGHDIKARGYKFEHGQMATAIADESGDTYLFTATFGLTKLAPSDFMVVEN
jgi:hypothetical protein